MTEKKEVGSSNIILAPFLFIISFIKHFFIGIKFVFFDVWKNIISYRKAKNAFKKHERIETKSIVKEKKRRRCPYFNLC